MKLVVGWFKVDRGLAKLLARPAAVAEQRGVGLFADEGGGGAEQLPKPGGWLRSMERQQPV